MAAGPDVMGLVEADQAASVSMLQSSPAYLSHASYWERLSDAHQNSSVVRNVRPRHMQVAKLNWKNSRRVQRRYLHWARM